MANIAIIIYSLKGGGAEKAASLLSNNLEKNGHKVYFFIKDFGDETNYKYSGKVYKIINSATGSDYYDLCREARFVKQLKNKLKIDCSISFMEGSNFLNVLSKGKEKVIVSVRIHLTSNAAIEGNQKELRRLIPRLYNKADTVVALTEACKKDLIDNWGVKKGKVCVIPNIWDEKSIVNREEANISIKHPAILTLGRLEKQKAHWHIIKALSYIRENYGECHLYILGKGGIYNELVELAIKYNVADLVHFEGFKNDISDFLEKTDVYVHTSHFEGFPNVLLDAMGGGLPIISGDCPTGPNEILNPSDGVQYDGDVCWGEYGVLIKDMFSDINDDISKEEIELAKTLIRFFEDRDLLDEYSKKSSQRVKDYSQDRIYQLWRNEIGEK